KVSAQSHLYEIGDHVETQLSHVTSRHEGSPKERINRFGRDAKRFGQRHRVNDATIAPQIIHPCLSNFTGFLLVFLHDLLGLLEQLSRGGGKILTVALARSR